MCSCANAQRRHSRQPRRSTGVVQRSAGRAIRAVRCTAEAARAGAKGYWHRAARSGMLGDATMSNPTYRVGQYVRFGDSPREAEYREQVAEAKRLAEEDYDTRSKLGWAAGYRAGRGVETDPTSRDPDWQMAFREAHEVGRWVTDGQGAEDAQASYRLGWAAGYRTARSEGVSAEHRAEPDDEAWRDGYRDGAERGKRDSARKSTPPHPEGFTVLPV